MCSIVGGRNRETVERMLDLMRHRSPDGMKVVGDDFCIGMGRLAVIDLVSPDLFPFVEGNYVLTFNGEIYNYIELREELKQKGHVFKTFSDTEVVLTAYKEWGVGCLQKFNGMFAFAIYDGKELFFARDIAGEKPLYYSLRPFAFASEAKALNWKCREFPPASFGIYDFASRKMQIFRYWNCPKVEIDPKTAEEELEKLIKDSIRLRTRSDVPYALYYSGGVDSSLLSTFHDFKFKFTYIDSDSYRDEYLERFERILWHLDYPVSSFSPFGLWKLAEEASRSVKVVISGEGADELFGGYIRYLKPHFNYLAAKQYPSYDSIFLPRENVNGLGWQEFNGNMRELLRMGDRMASAFGIENRCPFLDKRIIEFAFSLPDEFKIRGLETKVILNNILRKRNPEYQSIEKAGLYCSVNRWIGANTRFGKKEYKRRQNVIWNKIRSQS